MRKPENKLEQIKLLLQEADCPLQLSHELLESLNKKHNHSITGLDLLFNDKLEYELTLLMISQKKLQLNKERARKLERYNNFNNWQL